MQRTLKLGITAFLLLFSCLTFSNQEFIQRRDVQSFIKSMSKEHHFSTAQLRAILNQVVIQPDIISSMERPYEKKTWDLYKSLFLTPARLKGGIDFWLANKSALEKAEKTYGVPPEIIIAILGVETLYGERQGEYRVLDALATLAFNYPKRSAYFTSELKEFLLLCRENGVSPILYKGSYAGAIGQPQFMPSSYRNYAVDFDNSGKRDIVTNSTDSIGSIANYFYRHGWKPNEGIAQHASITGSRYKYMQVNPKKANYSYYHLMTNGIKPMTAAHNHPSNAGIIELITAQGNEYWIAYPNFFVITRYNSSPQYALVVYLLSQQLKQQWIAMNSKKHRAYV